MAGATARLVPWQLEADGTDPLVMGIYDQQEKVHCRFLPDETGQLRCFPVALATFAETPWFSDAACTKRIYTTPLNGTGGSWVDRRTALPLPRVACAPNRYVVGTLKAFTGATPHFGGTPCAEIQPAPGFSSAVAEMTVVDVQAPEPWAKGTAVDGPLIGQRMRLELVEGSDGTRFSNALHDERWNRPCQLAANGDDVFCLMSIPARAGVEGTQCAGPPIWRAHACDAPPYLDGEGGAVAVGPAWSGPVSSSGHGCIQIRPTSTVDGPDIFLTAGAPIGAVAATPMPWQATGTGRLRLRGLLGHDGHVVTLPTTLLWSEFDTAVLQGAHARYFDSAANVTCNPIRTPEGLLRCIPASVAVTFPSGFFADANCTEPAFFCPKYAATCPGVVAMNASVEPNGEVRARRLSNTRATKVFMGAPGLCAPSSVTSPGMFALDTDAPWTPFAVLAERNVRAPDGL